MKRTSDTWPSKDGLRIGHLNVNSVYSKLEEIATILDNNGQNFHVFGLSESKLNHSIPDTDLDIPGYNFIRQDKAKQKETGLLIYYSQTLSIKRISKLETYPLECVWIEIKLKHSKPLSVCFLYRNPKETNDWFDRFTLMMDAAEMLDNEIILLGDFNIDLFKHYEQWVKIYESYNLHQLIDRPTRETDNTGTLIDHIYVSSTRHIAEVCSPVTYCSDHYPVCLTWAKKGTKVPQVGHKTIRYRCFKRFDKESFHSDLQNSDLSKAYQYYDPEEAFKFWIKTFCDIYDKHAPMRIKRVKNKPKPPWITDEIDQAAYLRDSYKKAKDPRAKEQRNLVNSMKRRAKRKYFRELLLDKNPKQIWKAINALTKKDHLKHQNQSTTLSPVLLNKHFVSIAENLIQNDTWKQNDLEPLKEFCASKGIQSPMILPLLTTNQVYSALKQLKQSTTKDTDGLDSIILKQSAHLITDTLTYIYNTCISNNYFPDQLKNAKIIPLLKSGDDSDPSNYRPISILSVLSKPLEKHMQTHLSKHLQKYDLLHQSQSGFRKQHSCHTALINMVDTWLRNINENRYTGIVFADFAKAFDVINHSLLLQKLSVYGIGDQMCQLLESFLTNRQQKVCIGLRQSPYLTNKYGIPQGSVLGPLLFLMYINDLPLSVKDTCNIFADDSSVESTHSSLNVLSTKIQNNVHQLAKWADLNHMSLNPKKTKYMCLTTRQKRQNLSSTSFQIQIMGHTIEETHSHKVLGITIDNTLSWSEHTEALSKKVSQRIFQLSKIKHFLDRNARKQFFYAHIDSLIRYASTLWDSASANVLKSLVRLHKRAVKLVLLKSTTLTNDDYKAVGILPFKSQLEHNKAMMMHKIMTGNAPQSLINHFPINTNRLSNKLLLPTPRLDLFKSSLVYSGSVYWNNLPATLKTTRNPVSFRKLLKRFLINKLHK